MLSVLILYKWCIHAWIIALHCLNVCTFKSAQNSVMTSHSVVNSYKYRLHFTDRRSHAASSRKKVRIYALFTIFQKESRITGRVNMRSDIPSAASPNWHRIQFLHTYFSIVPTPCLQAGSNSTPQVWEISAARYRSPSWTYCTSWWAGWSRHHQRCRNLCRPSTQITAVMPNGM